MVRDGLIVWTVDDMRLASRALEPTQCIRNAHRTRSIRTAVRWRWCCCARESQHSTDDVGSVDVPSGSTTIASLSADRTSVVVNVTATRAGVGADQSYNPLSEMTCWCTKNTKESLYQGHILGYCMIWILSLWLCKLRCFHHVEPHCNLLICFASEQNLGLISF